MEIEKRTRKTNLLNINKNDLGVKMCLVTVQKGTLPSKDVFSLAPLFYSNQVTEI